MPENYVLNMNNKFEDTIKENKDIEIGRIIRFLLMQSKLIIFSVLSVFILSLSLYFVSTKFYKITSLIQVDSAGNNIFDPMDTFYANNANSQSDISNLITLYKSRTNILKLINDLNLNIVINDVDIKKLQNISIKEIEEIPDDQIVFFIKPDLNNISLLDEDKNLIQSASSTEKFQFNGLEIKIDLNKNIQKGLVKIIYIKPSILYNKYKNSINVKATSTGNNFFNRDGIIEVSYITDDIALGKNIVNYANKIFLDYRISVDTEKARKAIDFIDKNIKTMEIVVEKNKNKLKEFRENNKSINVDLEIEAIIKNLQSLDSSISEVELELSNASDVYTSNNPIYINLQNKKNILSKQREQIILQVEQLPKEQQEYIDLFKDVEISEKLFEELEGRRLSYSIMEASTISNIRVVDEAFKDIRVSPSIINVILLTFFTFILACLVAIIRGFNYLPVTNPAELFDNNINQSILGVLPFVEDEEILKDPNFKTSLESLIVNIKSIKEKQDEAIILSVTSPSSYNGKSTISRSLSRTLSDIGHKVVLIDGDYKRGGQHKYFKIKPINEKDFYQIDSSNIESFKVGGSLYCIPRVKSSLNSFQFISSKQYKQTIENLKKEFDYIIFDTAPILAVSDTAMLLNKSDINILTVRHNLTKINEIKQSLKSIEQLRLITDGIIYNSYSRPKGYYGYYGLYGNYSYQYYAERYLNDEYYNKE